MRGAETPKGEKGITNLAADGHKHVDANSSRDAAFQLDADAFLYVSNRRNADEDAPCSDPDHHAGPRRGL